VAQGIQYLHREGVIHCDLRGVSASLFVYCALMIIPI